MHRQLFGQAATIAAQSDEVHVRGQVVAVAVRAGVDLAGDDVGLDHHVLSDREVIHALAEFIDHPAHLVPERDRCRLTRDGLWCVLARAKDRPVQKFVQVGAADAAPRDVDPDVAGPDHRVRDLLDPNVVIAVVACSPHKCLQVCSRSATSLAPEVDA